MKFIIYGYMRSGTTMLTTMLNSHPELKCYAEESVDTLSTINNNEGINVKYSHLKSNEILEYVDQYKIIHLIRTNVFHTAISNFINDNKQSTKTPTAHIFSKNENLYYLTKQEKHDNQVPMAKRQFHKDIEKDKIHVDSNVIFNSMKNIHKEVNNELQILGTHKNVLTLTYEELTSNDTDIKYLDNNLSNKICNFLEVDNHEMYATTMKVNNSNYEKYISNWHELKPLKQMITT